LRLRAIPPPLLGNATYAIVDMGSLYDAVNKIDHAASDSGRNAGTGEKAAERQSE